MFKEITLPFEARVGASLFLNSPRQGQTMAELRKAHEIHQQFELDFVEEWIEKNAPNGILVFTAIEKAQIEPVRVRLDEIYTDWLKEKLEDFDWGSTPNQMGQPVARPVTSTLRKCALALGKALREIKDTVE